VASDGFTVRRLAAIDMHGTRGAIRRRRIVTAEFILASVGLLTAGTAAWARGGWLAGGWLIGAGVNYIPLAAYAITFYSTEQLAAELRDVDPARELRRYALAQFLLLLPLLVALLALVQLRRNPRPAAPAPATSRIPAPPQDENNPTTHPPKARQDQ